MRHSTEPENYILCWTYYSVSGYIVLHSTEPENYTVHCVGTEHENYTL